MCSGEYDSLQHLWTSVKAIQLVIDQNCADIKRRLATTFEPTLHDETLKVTLPENLASRAYETYKSEVERQWEAKLRWSDRETNLEALVHASALLQLLNILILFVLLDPVFLFWLGRVLPRRRRTPCNRHHFQNPKPQQMQTPAVSTQHSKQLRQQNLPRSLPSTCLFMLNSTFLWDVTWFLHSCPTHQNWMPQC